MDSQQILQSFINAINEYSTERMEAVQKGLETPALSALLLEKFGYGIIKAARILEMHDNNRLYDELDRLLVSIDPNVLENRKLRYSTLNADLKFGPER